MEDVFFSFYRITTCLFETATFGQNRRGTNEKLLSPKECEGGATTLDITSERMTYESKVRTFVFEEKVIVRRCTMVMTCDRLQVINGANERNVERIIATGHVKFQQGSRHAWLKKRIILKQSKS